MIKTSYYSQVLYSMSPYCMYFAVCEVNIKHIYGVAAIQSGGLLLTKELLNCSIVNIGLSCKNLF